MRKRQDSIQQGINLMYLDRLSQTELANMRLDSSAKELNLKYAQRLTEFELLNKRRDAESREIDNEKKSIELKYLKSRKVDYYGAVEVVKISEGNDGINTYHAKVNLDIINSSGVELEVSFVGIQLFSAKLPSCKLNADSMCVTSLTDPPCIYRFDNDMDWKEIYYEFSEIPFKTSKHKFWENIYYKFFMRKHVSNSNGWGAGIWKPGEKVKNFSVFTIKSKKDKAFAVAISLTVNGGIENDDDNIHLTYTRNLKEAKLKDE